MARPLHRHVRELLGDDPKDLLGVLATIAQDPRAKDADRISATRELLDRGYGKAVAVHVVDGAAEPGGLDQAIRELLGAEDDTVRPAPPRLLEAVTGGQTDAPAAPAGQTPPSSSPPRPAGGGEGWMDAAEGTTT